MYSVETLSELYRGCPSAVSRKRQSGSAASGFRSRISAVRGS